MGVNRITFDLAVYEVQMTDNWASPDYAKEHFEKGVFIVHDGVNYLFGSWAGGSEYVYTVGIPNDVILGVMAKEIKKEAESALGEVLENINDRLSQIARLTGECRDKCDGVINNFVEVRDDLIDTIDEKFSGFYRGGEGVNILDVARAAAVIQKPELIKELNK